LTSSGSAHLGHGARKTEEVALRTCDPSLATGWSRPVIDAINSSEESSSLGFLWRTIWYSARHSSIAAATSSTESGKASTRAASKKGDGAKEQKRKSGRRDIPWRACSSRWRLAWNLQYRARQTPTSWRAYPDQTSGGQLTPRFQRCAS
jgi:hypothetical protein